MKIKLTSVFTHFSMILTFVVFTLVPQTTAQYEPYTQWHLPEGAKARLGKGGINEIVYSPNSTRMAIASSVGIWIYDGHSGKELALLAGHMDEVSSIAYSPDGTTIASGSRDNTVRLWDAKTGQLLRTFTGHKEGINVVAYSPDGTTIASGSRDNTMRLWDVETGTLIATLTGHTSGISSIAYSPNGSTLASGSWDETVRLWDVRTGTFTLILTSRFVRRIMYSPDGKTILTMGRLHSDNIVQLWDADTGKHKAALVHAASVNDTAYSPDGKTIATVSYKEVGLWDTDTGERKITPIRQKGGVLSVAFSPDGETIVTGGGYGNRTVQLWDANTGKHNTTLTEYIGGIVSYSPDGKTIAIRRVNPAVIDLWNAATNQHKAVLGGHTYSIDTITFSPNGKTIACADGAVQLWDANTGKHKSRLEHTYSYVNSVAYSPDGRTIASGSSGDGVWLWDANTGKHKHTSTILAGSVSSSGRTGQIFSIVFSPDGKTVATASFDLNNVFLWDAATGQHKYTLRGHTGDVSSIAYSPDGRTIATASIDGTVRLWNTATKQHKYTLIGNTGRVHSVTYSPDGRTIASGGRGDGVWLWDANTGEHKRTLEHTNGVNSVVYSPNGRTLASAGPDSMVWLWDVDTGEHKATLKGHSDIVESLSYSPDGSTLASGSWDGTILLWELTPSATKNTIVSLSPDTVQSPAIDEQLTLSLKINDGENVAGYQATVSYDPTALQYVESANGDYLPSGAFFIPPVTEGNTVTLAASSLAGESNGDGTLATLTFEVLAVKPSTVRLTNVLLTDGSGSSSVPQIENAEITEPPQLPEDVNQDGVVNIIDLTLVASNFGKIGSNNADVNNDGVVNIIDLTLVAAAFGNTAAAPEVRHLNLDSVITRAQIEQWLSEARQLNLTDPTFQRGIRVLEQLLVSLTPKETVLLPNYPNPFNPETWIPYQLAKPADVSVSIYTAGGQLVRTLDLGHHAIGIYESRSRAAYWDGRNTVGEPVASGVYFYTLTAGDFTATRKLLIAK